jgi:hypothetical protein
VFRELSKNLSLANKAGLFYGKATGNLRQITGSNERSLLCPAPILPEKINAYPFGFAPILEGCRRGYIQAHKMFCRCPVPMGPGESGFVGLRPGPSG